MNNQLKKVYKAKYSDNPDYKSVEQQLADIKSKTIPPEFSDSWRSPLAYNNQQPWYQKAPKEYTEIEQVQHKLIFKETYQKAKDGKNNLSFMQDALTVLKKIMEQENK